MKCLNFKEISYSKENHGMEHVNEFELLSPIILLDKIFLLVKIGLKKKSYF